MLTNPFVVGFGCKFKLDNLVLLISLIPGLLTPPLPPFNTGSRERPLKSQLSATTHSWTLKWVQPGTSENQPQKG
jgi:hypothetical protein